MVGEDLPSRAATLSESTPTTGPSRRTAGSPESRSARIASSVRGQAWDWTIVVMAIFVGEEEAGEL